MLLLYLFVSHLLLFAHLRFICVAYVEGTETSAVTIEGLVVELDELLWSVGQSRSRFGWWSVRGGCVGGVVRGVCSGWYIRAMALKSAKVEQSVLSV